MYEPQNGQRKAEETEKNAYIGLEFGLSLGESVTVRRSWLVVFINAVSRMYRSQPFCSIATDFTIRTGSSQTSEVGWHMLGQ